MPEILTDRDWEILVSRISEGKCTPFIGAGACYDILPLGKDIANEWAKNHGYPLEDVDDLGSVAQYMAITHDPLFPKEEMSRLLRKVSPSGFSSIEESHGFIASLPLPVYITTNYDDFLYKALRSKGKEPKRVVCQWNSYLKNGNEYLLNPDFKGTKDRPIIFHLHGLNELPESMVLTEDDYVDFLVNVSNNKMEIIPHQIRRALTGSSLLFIGYSLRDWSFRVVFRGLVSKMEASMRRINVAVQLPKTEKAKNEYLESYFSNMKIKVFWGPADEFMTQLKDKMDEYNKR